MSGRGVAHNFVGEIEFEVSDPVDVFVDFVYFFTLSFSYLFDFLEFREHLVVSLRGASGPGRYLARHFSQFDPLSAHGANEDPSELTLELLIEGATNTLL